MRCSATSLLTMSFLKATIALYCAMLLFVLIGCAADKQTWQDWPHHRDTPGGNLPRVPVPISHDHPLTLVEPYKVGDGATAGPGFDLLMRNPDFPRTHIESIHIDLTAPDRFVRLKWTGTNAAQGPTGPWQTTPGRGADGFDCNDVKQSNTLDSLCTPKGVFPVAGFSDHLRTAPHCLYATWVLPAPRYIALHSHTVLPREAVSSGCVRMPYEAAKLIHNNSIAGITLIHIDGKWERPAKRN